MRKILFRTSLALWGICLSGLAAGAEPVRPSPQAAGGNNSVVVQDAAEAIDPSVQYEHCVALARSKPDQGWEESLAWGSLGGGDEARHCGAVALFGLKQYAESAMRLEALAQTSRKAARLRAGMLAQAGQGWMMAGLHRGDHAGEYRGLTQEEMAP